MTDQLTGYEASSVVEVEAVLDDSPADAEEVYLRTIGHSERAIAAVAAKRAGSGGGGGSLPSQWSVDGDGNLDITPSGDGTALALQIKSPLSLDDGGTIFEIDTDAGDTVVFYVAGDGAYVCDNDGNPYVGFRPDGSIALGPTLGNAGLNLSISGARIDLPSGGTLKVYSSDGHELLNVEDGGFLSFKNTSGQYVFQARNDGSVHIPTGTTIQADL